MHEEWAEDRALGSYDCGNTHDISFFKKLKYDLRRDLREVEAELKEHRESGEHLWKTTADYVKEIEARLAR